MNIGLYIYDNAEVLDFSGPFEVFSTAKRIAQNNWNIFLVAETDGLVKARGNFSVSPHYTIENHPVIDVLVVVGGIHTQEVKKSHVIAWISKVAPSARKVVSVCTGAFLLAEAGLLNGLSVTTHWEDIPDLKSDYPELRVLENQRWVSEGKFVTSGGISAGIDMSLFLVAELSSDALAQKTARQMEYDWRSRPNRTG
jgi:transcriptional regulator GlxA family with amidase domain